MSRSALARLQPYAQAIIAVAIATLIRLWMDPWLHGGQIFSWYYVAVALGAWCGGWRCSLLAAVLGYVAADWFFIEPRNSFSAVNQLLGLASYVSVCGAIASCTEAIRRRSPALVFRLDLDDGIDLLDIASAVRIHDISPADLQAYLDGLNVSAGVYRLATHLSRQDMTSRELASQLERVVKGSGRSGGFCQA